MANGTNSSSSSAEPPFLTTLNVQETVVSSLTYDQAFPTIPVEDDPTPSDLLGVNLISDIADFARPLPIEPQPDDTAASTTLYGYDLSFDFDTGEPVGIQVGSLATVEGDEQILQWCIKCLTTPQGRYPIYPLGYGSTLQDLVGEAMPLQTLQSEIARTATECMLAEPRVSDAIIDAVYIDPILSANGAFITGRIWLESSDEPIPVTAAVST